MLGGVDGEPVPPPERRREIDTRLNAIRARLNTLRERDREAMRSRTATPGERVEAARRHAVEAYVAAATSTAPIPGESERLTGARRAGEAAMLALRTAEGVDVARFAERYGIDFHDFYRPVVTEMRAAGTLDVTPSHVRLTPRGRFVANDVCAAFVTFAGTGP